MFLKSVTVIIALLLCVSVQSLYSQKPADKKKDAKTEIFIQEPKNDEETLKKKTAEKSRMLETTGALSSTNLYLTYVSLTLMKNEIDNGLASDYHDRILQSIKSTTAMMKENIELLKKDVLLISTDKEYVDKLLENFDIITEDAELLYVYFKSKAKADNDNFMNQHKRVWDALQKIMAPEQN